MTSRPCCDEVAHGVGDHGEVFLRRDAEDFGDVEQPGFAEDGDDGRVGVEEQAHLGVLGDGRVGAAGRAEGGEFGVAGVSGRGPASKNSWSRGLEPGQPPSM